MSKHLLTILAALLCGIAFAEFTPAEIEFMNRRRAVKRERIAIGTNEYWVVTYMRGAKPDGVKTNLAHKIEGVPQTNPLQELAERWHTAATNSAARVERISTALDDRRAEYVAKRDAATLPTTKAIYQAFIDAIDDIKGKLGISEGE